MASGCKIQDKCKAEFQNIKMGHKYRYVIFKLDKDYKEVEVEHVAPCSATYDDLIADLKSAEDKKECRYAVYDFEYHTKEEGRPQSKLVFLYWSPEGAVVKQKMVYSATCKALTAELQPGIKSIQLNDHGDLDYNNVLDQL